MLKKYKWNLLLSSLLILLPLVAGLLFWEQLPEILTGGTKLLFVVGLPLFLLVMQWFCILFTLKDPKNREQSPKVLGVVLWIVPLINLLVSGVMYCAFQGSAVNPGIWVSLLLGSVFVIIGNYLPKCKQNITIGIKIKWTLQSEENWNATHRFAGRVWVVGGFLLLILAFLPERVQLAVLLASVAAMVLIPTVYSYRYYKKQLSAGNNDITPYQYTKAQKTALRVSLIVVPLILVGVAILMFTGKVSATCGEDSLKIKATYWEDMTIRYDDIEKAEFREAGVSGSRIMGFGSARLQLGQFSNKEFGTYTRYTCDRNPCVVLYTTKGIVVVGTENALEIYQTLVTKGVGQ